MIFASYEMASKAYQLWDPQGRKIVISTNVKFDEMDIPNNPHRALPAPTPAQPIASSSQSPAAPPPLNAPWFFDDEEEPKKPSYPLSLMIRATARESNGQIRLSSLHLLLSPPPRLNLLVIHHLILIHLNVNQHLPTILLLLLCLTLHHLRILLRNHLLRPKSHLDLSESLSLLRDILAAHLV